ncbi:hypothetical protein JQC67_09565 [Aurantibacter crassamenti]|uniref:hypothetical protein n=1 Tax=Aurantibacter crassamenti TaxID=1837375 RepID=UPI0019396D81|nr:hypothetical protein [Aurantibacter crassamenti]MBM1106383.1 hypothetical protein [Aurantibacter crassamenti]
MNEILSDTMDLKIIESKSQLISNYSYMVPPFLPIDPTNSRKTISLTRYIADSLKVMDTMFIKNQFIDNKKLNLNRLSDYGYKIFDYKTIVENKVPEDSIWKLVDSLNKGTENYSFLKISKPVFNENKSLAYIRLEQGSGGDSYILEKVDGKWTKKYHLAMWVE